MRLLILFWAIEFIHIQNQVVAIRFILIRVGDNRIPTGNTNT